EQQRGLVAQIEPALWRPLHWLDHWWQHWDRCRGRWRRWWLSAGRWWPGALYGLLWLRWRRLEGFGGLRLQCRVIVPALRQFDAKATGGLADIGGIDAHLLGDEIVRPVPVFSVDANELVLPPMDP